MRTNLYHYCDPQFQIGADHLYMCYIYIQNYHQSRTLNSCHVGLDIIIILSIYWNPFIGIYCECKK